jgi:hypothetical protein
LYIWSYFLVFHFFKKWSSISLFPFIFQNKNRHQTAAIILAHTDIGGVATIENVSSGQTVSYTFSNEASEGSLCEYNAEWIIEDFEEGSSLVQFADFGTVTFTGASATDGSGTVGVSGAEIIDIEQNNKVLTSCSTSGSNEVSCTYT